MCCRARRCAGESCLRAELRRRRRAHTDGVGKIAAGGEARIEAGAIAEADVDGTDGMIAAGVTREAIAVDGIYKSLGATEALGLWLPLQRPARR